jgi:hypothetical protein
VSSSRRRFGHDHDLGALIELRDHHIDALIRPDVDFLADDIRVNRELASAAIDEHRQ